MKFLTLLLVVVVTQANSVAVQREMTVEIPAGREECYFETVRSGQTLDVDYQVVDGGRQNELEINFKVIKPSGVPLLADFRRSDGTHRNIVEEEGDYKICFDNSISRFSGKIVYLEISVESEAGGDNSQDELKRIYRKLEVKNTEEKGYDIKQVQDIEDALVGIKDRMGRSRQFQDQLRTFEFRDRSIAEHNYERVNFWSGLQISIMLLAGIVQVVLVRSLFDETSSFHRLWKVVC